MPRVSLPCSARQLTRLSLANTQAGLQAPEFLTAAGHSDSLGLSQAEARVKGRPDLLLRVIPPQLWLSRDEMATGVPYVSRRFGEA